MTIERRSLFLYIFLVVFLVVNISCKGRFRYRKKAEKGKGVYHTVKKGETFWRISKTYSVDIKMLATINKISDITKISEGDKLFIPGAEAVKEIAVYSQGDDDNPQSYLTKGVVPSLLRNGDFVWPIKGRLSSSFGHRGERMHDGIDIAAPEGEIIKAAAEGKVIFSGLGPKGYGKIVIIKHKGNIVTVYAHNSKNIVSDGDFVDQGDEIANIGNTGRATGYHLHFEIRKNNIPQDPLSYLP